MFSKQIARLKGELAWLREQKPEDELAKKILQSKIYWREGKLKTLEGRQKIYETSVGKQREAAKGYGII